MNKPTSVAASMMFHALLMVSQTGCVVFWGTGGGTVTEAYAVPEGFDFDAWQLAQQRFAYNGLGGPAARELMEEFGFARVDAVILVTMYAQRTPAPRVYALIDAQRVRPRHSMVRYPFRLYPIFIHPLDRYSTWSAEPRWMVLAFSEDHWPVMFGSSPSYGPSCIPTRLDSWYPKPAGADEVIRCVFYPRSRPLDPPVARAANILGEPHDLLDLVASAQMDEFCNLIEGAPRLARADRSLVYSQLHDLVTAARHLNYLDAGTKRRLTTAKESLARKSADNRCPRQHAIGTPRLKGGADPGGQALRLR